jgi:hypothetical protein
MLVEAPTITAHMTAPIRIEPDSVFDDRSLAYALGLTTSALAAGRRSGALRYTRRGHRNFYTGRWVLDWIQADASPAAAPRAEAVAS